MTRDEIAKLRPGQLVEYKRNGQAGYYTARFKCTTGGRVVLRVLGYGMVDAPTEADETEVGMLVRVLPHRILRARP